MRQKIFALGYHMIGENEEAFRFALKAGGLAQAARVFRRYPPHYDGEARLWLLLTEAEGWTEREAAEVLGRPPELPEGCAHEHSDPDGCLSCYRKTAPERKAPEAPPEEPDQNPFTLPRRLVGTVLLVASLAFGGWFAIRASLAALAPVPRLVTNEWKVFHYIPESQP